MSLNDCSYILPSFLLPHQAECIGKRGIAGAKVCTICLQSGSSISGTAAPPCSFLCIHLQLQFLNTYIFCLQALDSPSFFILLQLHFCQSAWEDSTLYHEQWEALSADNSKIYEACFSQIYSCYTRKKKMQHNRYLYSQGRCQNKAAHAVPIAAQLMPTNRVQVKASKEMQPSGQEVFRKHMQSKLHKSTNLKCMSRWVSALGLVLQHCGVQLTSLFRNRVSYLQILC